MKRDEHDQQVGDDDHGTECDWHFCSCCRNFGGDYNAAAAVAVSAAASAAEAAAAHPLGLR